MCIRDRFCRVWAKNYLQTAARLLNFLLRILDGLAFLPTHDVDEGMQLLRANIPSVPGLQNLLDYFSATYIYGVARPVRRPNAGQQLVIRVYAKFRRCFRLPCGTSMSRQ